MQAGRGPALTLTLIVILAVSGALILGAAWGIYGRLSQPVKGFIVALAGGALMVAAVLELIEPATQQAPVWAALASVVVGAGAFAALDSWVERRWGTESGGGLLMAVTLDGIPENLALGVALIGGGPMEVAALAGSIFLSNLPEAAGGAKEMVAGGHSRIRVLGIWAMTAALLAVAALAGRLLLADVPDDVQGVLRSLAGGAVVASLAVTVFPKAFKEDSYVAGLAAAAGLALAFALHQLQ